MEECVPTGHLAFRLQSFRNTQPGVLLQDYTCNLRIPSSLANSEPALVTWRLSEKQKWSKNL